MTKKYVAVAVAASVAGIYSYIVWKRQVKKYEEAKARTMDKVKTLALKVATGTVLTMGVYIYLHDILNRNTKRNI